MLKDLFEADILALPTNARRTDRAYVREGGALHTQNPRKGEHFQAGGNGFAANICTQPRMRSRLHLKFRVHVHKTGQSGAELLSILLRDFEADFKPIAFAL